MLVLDVPILREIELVLVWTVHTLFEYAQCPLLENQFVSSIHKSQDLGFCFWEHLFFFSSQNDPELTVV